MKHMVNTLLLFLSLFITHHAFSSYYHARFEGIQITGPGQIGGIHFPEGFSGDISIENDTVTINGNRYQRSQLSGGVVVRNGRVFVNGRCLDNPGEPRNEPVAIINGRCIPRSLIDRHGFSVRNGQIFIGDVPLDSIESDTQTETGISGEKPPCIEEFNKTFGPLSMLTIDNPTGSISINTHDSHQTQVTVKHTNRCHIEEQMHDARLTLATRAKRFLTDPADYSVHVPHRCDLLIKTVSALTTIVGGHGRTEVDRTSGKTSIENRSGSFAIDATSAQLTTKHTSGPLKVDTSSGSVESYNHKGIFRFNTTSGDARLINTSPGIEAVDIDCTSGRSYLELPDDDVHLDFDTISGNISVTLPGMSTLHVGNTFNTRLGSGQKTIKVSATCGSIQYIKKATRK